MYGKIFESIYDGTLADHWQALITFEQMIVLCDADGVIDKTPEALSRRTGIPLEHIEAGIKFLEEPDPRSRTEGEDGRRIVRLDSHREWGWQIVNHTKYKGLVDAETIREQNRERQRRKRERDRQNNELDLGGHVTVTEGNAESRHTDTDTNTEKDLTSGKPDGRPPGKKELNRQAAELIEFLNKRSGHNYKPVESHLRLIRARIKEGFTLQELKSMTAMMIRKWKDDPKMSDYIQPSTLYNGEKCASYCGKMARAD